MLIRIATVIVAVAVLQPAAADLPSRMSGRWKLNASLSEQPAERGGRRGGGASFAIAPAPGQRGGRGGGGGGAEPPSQMPILTEAETAAQRALGVVQQLAPEMTITATAAAITFVEPRGDSVFQIDGRNTAIAVPGGTIKVKTRWERDGLRQEFASTQRVLHRTWSVDASARQLTLKQRLEGIGLGGKESQAVFDRQ